MGNEQVKGWSDAEALGYLVAGPCVIEYRPDRVNPFIVRLIGLGCSRIDHEPIHMTQDILGFGKSLAEAARNALDQQAGWMMISDETDIFRLILADGWMMGILEAVRMLRLPDWWIGAGFVRSKVWDHLTRHTKRTPLSDIDVIYFDLSDTSEERDRELEEALGEMLPGEPWSVKNQARMHGVNDDLPYLSSVDALAHWPETATAVAVRLENDGSFRFAAPHGLNDLLHLRVRPTPWYRTRKDRYEERIAKKDWLSKWPELDIYHIG